MDDAFIGTTTDLNYTWDTETILNGIYTLKLVPWINGSRINATNYYVSNINISNVIDVDDDGDPNSTDCDESDPNVLSPRDNLLVDRSITLCPGTYYLNDSAGDGLLIMGTSSVNLNCNGTSIIGNGIGIGVNSSNYGSNNISGCLLSNFSTGILLDSSSENNLTRNILNNSVDLQINDITSVDNNLWLNNFYSSISDSWTNNNYCFNTEGNLYEESLTPGWNDCGQPTITSPTPGIYTSIITVYWTRQSSMLDYPVTYELRSENQSIGSTTDLNFTFNTAVLPNSEHTLKIVPWINGSRINATNTHLTGFNTSNLHDNDLDGDPHTTDCNDLDPNVISPRPNLVINRSVTFCPGTHYVNDSDMNGAIIISGTGITLDCNGSTLIGLGTGYAIYSNNQSGNTIANCRLSNYQRGIYLFFGGHNYLENNTVYDNSQYGILLSSTNNNSISNNMINESIHGIFSSISSNNTFVNNRVFNNTGNGFRLNANSNNNLLINNTANDNSEYGFFFGYSEFNELMGSNSFNNKEYGLYLSYSPNNTILQSNINNNMINGLLFVHSPGNTISENYFNNLGYDILLNDTASIDNKFYLNHIYATGIDDVPNVNSFCIGGEGNLYAEHLTPMSTDCGQSSITSPISGEYSGNINVIWTAQSVNPSDTIIYDVFANNNLINQTDALNYVWNASAFPNGIYTIKLVPWVNGSRVNATNYAVYPINITNIPDADGDGDLDATDCNDADPNTLSPRDNLQVNRSITLCPGIYNLNDTEGDGLLIVNGTGITLDCNGTEIFGTGIGIYTSNKSNTIENCIVSDYTTGISVDSDSNTVRNNILKNTANDISVSAISSNNNIYLNHIYGTGISDLGTNTLVCVGGEGNLYKLPITPAVGDCGPAGITYPIAGVYEDPLDITWGKQSVITGYNIIYDIYINSTFLNTTHLLTTPWNVSDWSTGNYKVVLMPRINNTDINLTRFEVEDVIIDYIVDIDTDGDPNITDCDDSDPNIMSLRDNLNVDKSIKLCSGVYNINDVGNDGILIINASDVTVDCNNSEIIGSSIGYGIYSENFNNITIINCNMQNYNSGVILLNSSDNNISSNILKNTFDLSVGDILSVNNLFYFNHFFGNGVDDLWTNNNYCVNNEGNFYKEEIVNIGYNDCGQTNVTFPTNGTYNQTFTINWTRQSAMPGYSVMYDIYYGASLLTTTPSLSYLWDNSLVSNGNYTITVVPWIDSPRTEATNAQSSEFEMLNFVCGNGIAQTGEECDGNDFSGTSCGTLGYDLGSLSCTTICTIDSSDCRNDGGGGGGGSGGGSGGGTVFIADAISCLPDWDCTDWSECVEGIKHRTCIDLKNCNDTEIKPLEEFTCYGDSCIPEWECSLWSVCKDGKSTRECTDKNECGIDLEAPLEEDCEVTEQTPLTESIPVPREPINLSSLLTKLKGLRDYLKYLLIPLALSVLVTLLLIGATLYTKHEVIKLGVFVEPETFYDWFKYTLKRIKEKLTFKTYTQAKKAAADSGPSMNDILEMKKLERNIMKLSAYGLTESEMVEKLKGVGWTQEQIDQALKKEGSLK